MSHRTPTTRQDHGKSAAGSWLTGQISSSAPPNKRALGLVLFVMVAASVTVLVVGVTPVAANNQGPVEGTVELDGTTPDNEFDAGEEGTLQITLSNEGEVVSNGTHPEEARDRATEARSTDVNITDTYGAPIEVRTDQQAVGTIDSGDTAAATFDIFVAEDADPGEYDVEVTAEYTNVTVTKYEEGVGGELEFEEETTNETRTFNATVTVADEARFEVRDIDHDIQVDDSGDYTLTIENTGSLDISNVVVTAQAPDQDVFFGSGGASSERSVGDWGAGETRTLTYRAGTSAEAVTEPYPVELTFEYTDPDGDDLTQTEQTQLQPKGEQAYDVTNISHDISVGDDGVLALELTNDGPKNVTDASVTVSTNDGAISFQDADGGAGSIETFVGDWQQGETKTLQLRTAVGDEAVQRNYTLAATISARDQADNELNDRTREFGFRPEPRQNYAVGNVSHDISVGDDGVLALELTNEGPQNVTDASVTVGTNDQAITFQDADGGTGSIETFVGDWQQGETKTLQFRTAVGEEAVQRNYTLTATVSASDENGSELNGRTREFGFRPKPRQQYVVEDVSHGIAIGDDGIAEVTIRNQGPQNVTNATVSVNANDQAVTFTDADGGSTTTETFVGNWAAGETKTISLSVGFAADAAQREYAVAATISARDENDSELSDRTREFGIEPLAEQRYTVEDVTHDVSVGDDGVLTVTLANDGPLDVTDASVTVGTNDQAITFQDADGGAGSIETFVGDWVAGETKTLQLRTAVGSDAVQRNYTLTATVSARDENDSALSDRTREFGFRPGPRQRYTVEDISHSVSIGDDGVLELELTNDGPQDVTAASVSVGTNDQAITFQDADGGAGSIESFVGDWEVGETKSLQLQTAVGDDAVERNYTLTATVSARDEDDSELSDRTREFGFEPQPRQRYDVDDVAHSVSIGDDGVLDVTMTNEGPQSVTDASVTVGTNDQAITFQDADGGAGSIETFVGDWAPGESKTLRLRTAVGEGAVQRNYTLDATVSARDEDDSALNDRTRSFGFEPEPRQLYVVENVSHRVVIGDDGVAEVVLRNTGPQNVTNATVSLSTNDQALTFTDADGGANTIQTFVGNWVAGETKTLRARVGASDNAVQREYAVDATISARDESDSTLNDRTREFGLEPLPAQHYTIQNVTHDVAVADDGTMTLEMTNEGPLNVTDASVTMNTNDAAIVFGSGAAGETVEVQGTAFETGNGGSPNSEAFIGDWAAGETKTLTYLVSTTEDALERNYTIEAAVDARDRNDTPLNTRNRQFGFHPRPEQTFEIEGQNSTLYPGEDGDVVGTITNTGTRTAQGVVIRFSSDLPNVFPRDTQYAVGELDPGETEQFRFRIGLSEEAEPTPRIFEFETRYRNPSGDVRLDDSQDILVDVGEQRNAFEIETVDASFEAGSSGLVEVELTNNRDERVENVRAKVFADAPLSSSDDEVFVSALDPGETKTVVFEVSVEGGANPKNYPLSMDVRYDDSRGETQLSNTYRVPVAVTESSDDGFSPLLLFAALIPLGGLLVYFRGRVGAVGAQLSGRIRD